MLPEHDRSAFDEIIDDVEHDMLMCIAGIVLGVVIALGAVAALGAILVFFPELLS